MDNGKLATKKCSSQKRNDIRKYIQQTNVNVSNYGNECKVG